MRMTKFEALMEHGAVKQRGSGYTIAHRIDETRTGSFNRAIYKERHVVERAIHRLKQVPVCGNSLREAGSPFPGDGHDCLSQALVMICKRP